MELNTISDAFDRVTKKQKLSLSKSQELTDQILHEIEQAMLKLMPDTISTDDQKLILTELKSKLNEIGPQKALEPSQKDLNVSLSKYLKLLGRNFNPDIMKAYRNIDFDSHFVNQIIAAHFYRDGFFDIGDCLLNEANEPEATTLKSQFMEMHQILEAMKDKNVKPALKWVVTNHEKLRQNTLNLELQLYRLQFIEILRNGNQSDALKYSRTYIAPFASSHIVVVQKLMGSLLWAGRLDISPYRESTAPKQWEIIGEEIIRQFCGLLGRSYESPLRVVIKAGLVGLPTLLKLVSVMPQEKQDWQAMKYLPVPIELGKEFQYHSIFVCPVTRDQSSDENPAMLMMCGHVLCKHSITKMLNGNSLMFKCPYCPTEISVAECRQLYL